MKSTLHPHTARQVSPAEVMRVVHARLTEEDFTGDPDREAAQTALLGVDGVQGNLILHQEEVGTEPPYGVVLQERPAGGTVAGHVGERPVTTLIRFECSKNRSDWDAWHSVMHQHIFTLMQGFLPTGLQTALCREAFEETRSPNTPMLDADDETRYSASGYTGTFIPAS